MIIRNFAQDEVLQGLYRAHRGGEAAMLFDNRELQGILFLAQCLLRPGKKLEAHVDPYEEIYYILRGEGVMMAGNEVKAVKPEDAIWIPYGIVHSLENNGQGDCDILVVAAFPKF